MGTITAEQRKGWAGTCDTVRVKADNEQGFAVINAEDFDKERHERYVDEAAEAKAAKKSKKDAA